MYSKQHKRKALLTRISSILLSATIAFTSLPVTNVYADTGVKDTAQNEGNKTQGGSTNQAESVGESVYGADIYQGYRMYMIEPTQLKRITDIYDFTYESWSSDSFQNEYFETRFDYGEVADIVEGTVHRNTIADLKNWCVIPGKTEQGQGGYLDVPTPINGLKAQGGLFKQWFLNGINTGITVNPGVGGGGLIYNPNANNSNINSGGSTSPGGNKEITEEHPVVDKPTDKIELGDSLYDGDFDYSDVIDYYGIEVKPVASGITNNIAGIGQQKAYEQAYKTALLEAEQKAKKVAMSIRDKLKATYNEKVKYYGNNYRSMSLNECKLAALADIKGNVNNATSCETVKTIAYRYLYNYCDLNETDIYTVSSSTALYINNNSDLLSTNIPLANEDFSNATQLQLNSPAFCILNQSEYIVIKDEYKQTYGDTAAIALSKGCLLVVEPLVMLYEMHQPGINDFARSCLKKYYYDKRSYGSVYNIIEHWGGSEVHTYIPRLTNLLPNSLVATQTFTTSSGYKIVGVDANADFYTTSSKRMTGLKEQMKTVQETGGNVPAIAMHIYDASMLGGNPSTSTYDELNGSLPNKSEDCTSKPEESSYTTTSKQVSIIKYYETVKSDGTIQNDGYYIRQNTPHTITIEDEDEINYKVIDWQTSSENNLPYGLTENSSGGKNYTYEQLVQSSNKLQSGTSAGNTVVLTETERILYVKLQKQESPTVQNTRLTGDYILNESELAKAFQITPISIEYTFPKITFSESRGCGGHYNHRDTDGDGIDDDYDTCGGASSSSGYISDSKAAVTLKNEAESSYSNIIVQSDKAKFKSDMTVAELNRGTNADSFNTSANHKYTFNVYRYQQGEQNLTLCKYWQKQSSNKDVSVGTTQTIAAGNKDIAKTLGYSEANSKSTKSRAEIDYIVNAVKFKFIFDTSSPDKSTSYYLHGDGCSCGGVHVGGYSRGKDIDTATIVESEADISVQVYSGTTSKPVHNKLWTETIGRNGEKYLPIRDNNNKTVGRQVQSTSTVKFNPFIKMTYSIVDDLKNNIVKKYPVNVLSEYQREILNTDYAEVAWQYQANSDNLSLLSNMWSTDEVLTDGDDNWRQKNQVLKGGASAALQIKDSDMRALTLRTYQTVFPDSDINDYLVNATDYSVDKAVAEHDAFIQSAVDTFEQLHIVQRVSNRIEDSIDDMADENKVERGGNISFLNNNSNTASSDSKYYLSKDLSGLNAGANEGDLDVKLGSTSKKFFKVWSDTSGNILIAEGTDINALKNNISGTVILTKNQDSSSLTNQTAIDLNNRTFIVDKLINAVERNTGNDTSAEWASSDGKWYNESFALYCMTQATDIRLGFRDVNTRAFVLDAKLCPYLSSKSQQGKTAHTSIFSTDSYSEKWGSSEEGRVGTFKGKPIYMEDMQRLFTSKLFYIPNMTVQGSR